MLCIFKAMMMHPHFNSRASPRPSENVQGRNVIQRILKHEAFLWTKFVTICGDWGGLGDVSIVVTSTLLKVLVLSILAFLKIKSRMALPENCFFLAADSTRTLQNIGHWQFAFLMRPFTASLVQLFRPIQQLIASRTGCNSPKSSWSIFSSCTRSAKMAS